MWCMGMLLGDKYEAFTDQSWGALATLVDGKWEAPSYGNIVAGLKALELADIRVGHNSQDFDERVTHKLFPWWAPKGRALDTLIIARLLYARVFKTGPNNHKLPPKLRMQHSLKAWGMRLGEHKQDYTPPDGDWNNFDPAMIPYMGQDVKTLKRLFVFLMSKKPSPQAVTIEHDFAAIIRRQEAWGFTFDFEKATELAAELQAMEAKLEASLIERFGEWWAPGKQHTVATTRRLKMPDYPNVTLKRFSPTTGRELSPYVGPPIMEYTEGAVFTPVERIMFNPGSRDHVHLKLTTTRGWKPSRFTKTGLPQIDDEVLRAMPWPEAHELADYYTIGKLLGYITKGKVAWLRTMRQEPDGFRQHGRVMTIGTYTHRTSASNPNMGQIPAVSSDEAKKPIMGLKGGYGYECRDLFKARTGFKLVGVDASGIQLRILAHRLFPWDNGDYAKIVSEEDPHAWIRDVVGTDIMGSGDVGRGHGKTLNYAILLGAGDVMAGSIPAPLESEAQQRKLGKEIKSRIAHRFPSLPSLQESLKVQVKENGYIIGLDGRKVDVLKAHTGLATQLQADEAVALKLALGLHDRRMQAEGYRCGVGPDGRCFPAENVDYEFVVNVYDEFQADVRDPVVPPYVESALWAIPEAGRVLNMKCPLKGEAKVGNTWAETH